MVSDNDYQRVSELLGRQPRGLAAIPVCSNSGDPVVIQVASLVDDKPFPTLYWLVDKQLNYAIDQLEAAGLIAHFQQRIDESQELQASMVDDHQRYIARRLSAMSETIRQQLTQLGFMEVLARRGIGGIENFARIRCLHTYYAAHLVESNTVGRLLDAYWQQRQVRFQHIG